jgi:biotin carboxyl carrier protein
VTTSTATQPASNPQPPRKDRTFQIIGVVLIVAICGIVLTFLTVRTSDSRTSLSDEQITQYLRNPSDPENVVLALHAMRVRIANKQTVSQWYPDLVKLASSRDDQVQHTVADVMSQDPRPEFHDPLLTLLRGNTLLVRNAAALALAQYDDTAGREQVLSILHPQPVTSPGAGKVNSVASVGRYVTHGDAIAKLRNGNTIIEVHSPVTGTVRSVSTQDDDVVSAGIDIAVVEPGAVQVIAGLRALQRIGYGEDIAVLEPFASAKATEEVRVEAQKTLAAIRVRAKR